MGGLYEQIGILQFEFLVANGLRPDHIFLDIACGSLRLGKLLIPYLEPEHYYGIDKEPELIKLGIQYELDSELIRSKRPYFVVSYDFEFEKFPCKADFAIAHSLFTHLPPRLIHKCFRNLLTKIKSHGVFFFFLQLFLRQKRKKKIHRNPTIIEAFSIPKTKCSFSVKLTAMFPNMLAAGDTRVVKLW